MRSTKRQLKAAKQNREEILTKLQNLIESELSTIETSRNLVILPIDDKHFQIKDYTLTILEDKVLCGHKRYPTIEFHTKQCAILYVLSSLRGDINTLVTAERLDKDLFYLKNEKIVLENLISRTFKSDPFTADVAESKLTVVKSKIKQVLESVKKYCFLTKYQKRI